MDEAQSTGGHDFDFLYGSWRIHNRRLSKALSGADDWYEFEATSWCRPLLAGTANVDEYLAPSLGLTGMTVRLFEPGSGEWSIYWASTTAPGPFQPPVVGRFTAGVGEFFCDDDYAGQPIRVRYTWTVAGEGSPRWEQAFSADGEVSWETNWKMELERTSVDLSGG